MGNLTAVRNTDELQEDREYPFPVEANTNIYLGGMIGLNAAGNAVPMSAAVGLKVLGRAERVQNGIPAQNALNNPGAAGALSIVARRGIFKWANSGAHPVVAGTVGGPCFAEDDHTVAANDETAALSCAGRVVAIDADGGVWVDSRLPFAIAT